MQRHGGYQDELDELYKHQELKGVELSHQGAHRLIQYEYEYELTWRSNRDVAMEADKGETDADLRQMRGRQTDRNKGNRSRSAPLDKGHRVADCRIKQTNMKNGTQGKREKQRPRKRRNGDRNPGCRGDNRYGDGNNKNGEKGPKGVVASWTGVVLARELSNLAPNKVVAELWKRLQLKHRHSLKRACVCPVGSLDIGFLSVRRGFLVQPSTAACREKMKSGTGGGAATHNPLQ